MVNLSRLALAGATSLLLEKGKLESRSTVAALPSGWSYAGCMVDVGQRILSAANQVTASNSPQNCISFCTQQGFSMAGIEYGQECWCGNGYNPSAGTPQAASESDCSIKCSGDAAQTCGGSSRIQVFKNTGTTPPATSTTSATPTAVPTPTSSTAVGKRGLAWPHENTQNPAIFKSKQVTWLYNWGRLNQGNNNDFPFYAMQWSSLDASKLAADVATSKPTYILGYNEPDNGGQANMTATEAAANWKTYIQPLAAKGYKLISPAVTNAGAPAGIAWLDAFFAACTGCTFHGVAIHWYGGWIDDFKSFVESAKKYNLPIYLTEFGFEWDQYATIDSFTQFLPLAFDYLDKDPMVVKYAFFGAFYSGTAKDMIAADGALTALGKMYIQ